MFTSRPALPALLMMLLADRRMLWLSMAPNKRLFKWYERELKKESAHEGVWCTGGWCQSGKRNRTDKHGMWMVCLWSMNGSMWQLQLCDSIRLINWERDGTRDSRKTCRTCETCETCETCRTCQTRWTCETCGTCGTCGTRWSDSKPKRHQCNETLKH